MNHLRHCLAALLLGGLSVHANAADPMPPENTHRSAEAFLASLHQLHGTVQLPGDVATLELPDGYYYLSPADTERMLTEGWGNPPGHQTLGMIVPQSVSPLSSHGWGVLVTYDNDGHVADDDAAKINYSDLLKQMKDDQEDANDDRKKQGYQGIHLLGWAEPPHYDPSTHKMYWARELQVDGASETTLNYSVRILGRQGVLELNAIAAMRDLPAIEPELPKILAFTNFDQGSRYSDYIPSTDKLASYGLTALVAGGIAAKAGLFAKIGLLLLAAKKFLIIAGVAVVAFVRKLFGRKSG